MHMYFTLLYVCMKFPFRKGNNAHTVCEVGRERERGSKAEVEIREREREREREKEKVSVCMRVCVCVRERERERERESGWVGGWVGGCVYVHSLFLGRTVCALCGFW